MLEKSCVENTRIFWKSGYIEWIRDVNRDFGYVSIVVMCEERHFLNMQLYFNLYLHCMFVRCIKIYADVDYNINFVKSSSHSDTYYIINFCRALEK